MADKTIAQQTEDTTPTADDFVLVWDNATGTTKKVSLSSLSALVRDNFDWYEEIGRTTLSGAADTITVSSLPTRKYLKIIYHIIASGSILTIGRFNNDSAANYAYQYFINNSGANSTSQTSINNFSAGTSSLFGTLEVVNVAAVHKLFSTVNSYSTSSAAVAANYVYFHGVWANTTTAINRFDMINSDTGDFASGSEIIVLGHD